MDLASIIGIAAAFGLVAFGILSGGSLMIFWDSASFLIVVGGTFGVILINYPLRDVLGLIPVVKKVFLHKLQSAPELIASLVELGTLTRKGGILSIEPRIKEITNTFYSKGLHMLVDGIESNSIKGVLEKEIDYVSERHKLGAEIFTTLAAFAPALGMIGTLIGLVQMLQNLEDPSSIGPAMAIALITTFYGALMANLLFMPIAGKLKKRNTEEMLVMELVMEGILSISAGENPRIMGQKLQVFLSPKQRTDSEEEGAEEARAEAA
ncbi:MotA/TolQ/ExbB proton channel family protein [Nitrospira defluvii]|nr:MotA/TolQ/ExbB proton channel family protein [Nitrospira defluvii]